jgi:hypothetical protein
VTDALEPQPATATSSATTDAQPSQPAEQLPEPSLPAEPDVKADSRPDEKADVRAPVVVAESNSRSEKVNRKRDDDARSATTATASEGRRATRAEPPSRREAAATTAPARAKRPTPNAVGERAGDRRRAPVAASRTRRTDGRVLSSSSRDTALPVFSPSPAARSGKKKVIPWP